MKIKNEYLGLDGFVWWIGIVEATDDPLRAGRYKVRCLEWHTKDKKVLPTADLPWSQVMMPVNSSSNSGIGNSPTGLLKGTWVLGFFLDGKDAQRPLIMGTIPGVPSTAPNKNIGFNDPDGVYPNKINEPDTNRLARNDLSDDYTHEVLEKLEEGRTKGIKLPNTNTTYDEPSTAYNANYPFNEVFETQGGHIREYDSTPGSERYHEYHPSGTFTEVNALGNKHTRITGRNYTVVANNDHVNIKGSCFLTIDQNCYTYIGGNWDIFVKGYKRETVNGEVVEKYMKNQFTTVENFIDIEGKRIDFNKSQAAGGGGGGLFGSGLLGRIASGVLTSVVLPAIGSSIMSELGNITSSLTDSSLIAGAIDTGGGTFPTEGTSLFMSATRSTARSVASSSSFLTRALNTVNTFSNPVGTLVDFGKTNITSNLTIPGFAGGNIDLGSIGKSAAEAVINGGSPISSLKLTAANFGGDLLKSFTGIDDMIANVKTNIDVVGLVGEKGAELIGDSIDTLFNPANVLNGFDVDIFKNNTLADAGSIILEQGIGMAGEKLDVNFDNSIVPYVNTKKLLRSVVDSDFALKSLPDKINESMNVEGIIDNLVKENEQIKQLTSAGYYSEDGMKAGLQDMLQKKLYTPIVQKYDTLVGGTIEGKQELQAKLEEVSPFDSGVFINPITKRKESIYTLPESELSQKTIGLGSENPGTGSNTGITAWYR